MSGATQRLALPEVGTAVAVWFQRKVRTGIVLHVAQMGIPMARVQFVDGKGAQRLKVLPWKVAPAVIERHTGAFAFAPATAPSCPSYLVFVTCPRCEQKSLKAHVFPTGARADVVIEHDCGVCGAPSVFSDAISAQLQEEAWDAPRDCENTVLKMAMKRAHVASVLSTFGLSEQFTQDVEETHGAAAAGAVAEEPTAPDVSPLDKTWPNWPNYKWAKQPFRVIPTTELAAQLEKTRRTVDRAREKKDARVVEMGEALLATIELVLEDRREHPEHAPPDEKSDEPTTGAGANASAAADLRAPEASASAAVTKAAAAPSALAADLNGEDDDLPF